MKEPRDGLHEKQKHGRRFTSQDPTVGGNEEDRNNHEKTKRRTS